MAIRATGNSTDQGSSKVLKVLLMLTMPVVLYLFQNIGSDEDSVVSESGLMSYRVLLRWFL